MGDAATLARVAQATFEETFTGLLAAEDVAAHCANKLSEAAHLAWLAEEEARLWLAESDDAIGYAGLATPDLPTPTDRYDIELKRIYVVRRLHSGGAGALLLNAALEEAAGMGKKRVLLGVYARNTRALAFYAKHRFKPICTRQFKVGANLYDDLVLARLL